MEGSGHNLPFAHTDDSHICIDQSFDMAAFCDRDGAAELTCSHGACTAGYGGISDRIALWSQGRGIRLLVGDDAMGDPAYHVVHPRHRDFAPGRRLGHQPAAFVRRDSRLVRFWGSTALPPL